MRSALKRLYAHNEREEEMVNNNFQDFLAGQASSGALAIPSVPKTLR
jgi:hypothetical protein